MEATYTVETTKDGEGEKQRRATSFGRRWLVLLAEEDKKDEKSPRRLRKNWTD
jgi:hypothetical protein